MIIARYFIHNYSVCGNAFERVNNDSLHISRHITGHSGVLVNIELKSATPSPYRCFYFIHSVNCIRVFG